MRGRTSIILSAAAVVAGASLLAAAPQQTGRGGTATTPRSGPSVSCAGDLGSGVKTKRQFCDVIVGADRTDSIAITVPAHKGAATLLFDLHNRFGVPQAGTVPEGIYARNEAIVAIVGPNGATIDRAAVFGEFRSPATLFDRIGGGSGPGGVKAIAPGPAEHIRVTIPAAVTSLGIVGVKVTVMTRGGVNVFDNPGFPVAVASNFFVDYVAR